MSANQAMTQAMEIASIVSRWVDPALQGDTLLINLVEAVHHVYNEAQNEVYEALKTTLSVYYDPVVVREAMAEIICNNI